MDDIWGVDYAFVFFTKLWSIIEVHSDRKTKKRPTLSKGRDWIGDIDDVSFIWVIKRCRSNHWVATFSEIRDVCLSFSVVIHVVFRRLSFKYKVWKRGWSISISVNREIYRANPPSEVPRKRFLIKRTKEVYAQSLFCKIVRSKSK